ncbi:unnamed protein product [Rangifer tarandus platyrhynchus]|uniref:Uncharacterized protein n=2 Tax=Rangifer tarandus platyrhynchus TaxID=3082113 RepID=A0ABN8ZBB9_RANTA|nr:unnamed protein product [Rangifer tarandus platyrhynchus]
MKYHVPPGMFTEHYSKQESSVFLRIAVSLGAQWSLLPCMWQQLPNSRHQLPPITPLSSSHSRVTLASSCAGTGDYTVSVQRGEMCLCLTSMHSARRSTPCYLVVTCSFFRVIGGKGKIMTGHLKGW